MRISFLVLGVIATACGAASPPKATSGPAVVAAAEERELRTIDPRSLHQKLQSAQQVVVYDNNRPETYALAHVPGAINVRPKEVAADKLPADKAAMLVFYCANEH